MRIGVLGATGFTGEKLVEILLSHPKGEITYLSSRTTQSVSYSELFPRFQKKINLECQPLDIKKAGKCTDILFLSLPHTISMQFVPYLIEEGKKVIDLSADYRFKDSNLYKNYFGVEHKDNDNLKKAVYGLPELFKKEISHAKLIANPGCYPTSVILALFPLLKEGLITNKIFVDAKSSITGAGRKPLIDYHYSNISGNVWAYKPFIHQHVPEITEILRQKTANNVKINFVPHVVGVETGIYSTIFVSFRKKVSREKIQEVFEKYYKNEPFIRIKKDLSKLKDVAESNFCDIGFALSEDKKDGVVTAAIDNLIKGAAGQAVQNMNIMAGWEETLGLL